MGWWMKWWMCDRTRNTTATSEAEEAFSGGLTSAYYSHNTFGGSIYNTAKKNFVRRFTDLDDQNARMVEN
jgi:hypothetical protein